MRIFNIKDESISDTKIQGYLIYYERPKAFYIELSPDANAWEAPQLLSSFAKRGQYSIGSYWSRKWAQQRIIPQDGTNVERILKKYRLKKYDEFALLKAANGRCEQDSCYIEELDEGEIPALLQERWQTKVTEVVPIENERLLVFFRNRAARIVDCKQAARGDNAVASYLKSRELFDGVEVQTDGHGVMWSNTAEISYMALYDSGQPVPLTLDDLCSFFRNRVVTTTQTYELLGCSRQNVDEYVQRDKLHPIRTELQFKLFLKGEVMQRRKK